MVVVVGFGSRKTDKQKKDRWEVLNERYCLETLIRRFHPARVDGVDFQVFNLFHGHDETEASIKYR